MPDDLRAFVSRRTRQTRHSSPAEYIQALVREDQKREANEKLDDLEQMIVDGLESGPPVEVGDIEKYVAEKKSAILNDKPLGKRAAGR